MIPLKNALHSSVGKKFIMALTGLALVLFVIVHLLGNLSLYLPDGIHFNQYAAALQNLGGLLIIGEVGLVFMFLIHIVTALQVTKRNRAARPEGYKYYKTKGGPTKSNLSSRSMIYSGLVLLGFLILHIWQFKFGPGVSMGYVQTVSGAEIRDLHRLVVETFKNPLFVVIYVAAMLFLGTHLRHGFWSAFQSLGANNPRLTRSLSVIGSLIALILAVGFLFIPVWIYFDLSGVLK